MVLHHMYLITLKLEPITKQYACTDHAVLNEWSNPHVIPLVLTRVTSHTIWPKQSKPIDSVQYCSIYELFTELIAVLF